MAAFFARYCFIRALAEDPAFDLQLHIEKDIFFTEIMKTLVDKWRGRAMTDETRTVRQTIQHYLLDSSTIINIRRIYPLILRTWNPTSEK